MECHSANVRWRQKKNIQNKPINQPTHTAFVVVPIRNYIYLNWNDGEKAQQTAVWMKQNENNQSVTTKNEQLNRFENENISRPKSMKP